MDNINGKEYEGLQDSDFTDVEIHENLLNRITEYYITSNDFNGLPFCEIKDADAKVLIILLENGKIEAYSPYEFINPHIKAFDIKSSKERQKELIVSEPDILVFYPTPNHLLALKLNDERPFTGPYCLTRTDQTGDFS